MNPTDWLPLIQVLTGAGLEFEAGLTDAEVDRIENQFSFRFPPDLRSFLQTAVPIWNSPRWHTATDAEIQRWLDRPIEGILFDVEHNGFWIPEWGEQGDDIRQALEVARAKIIRAPKLIPILGHRSIPELPNEAGNPIFSVYGGDTVYYGFDLEDYLRHEFNLPRKEWPAQVKQIEFWDPERFQLLFWGEDHSTRSA
jgi:hypothetical protein